MISDGYDSFVHSFVDYYSYGKSPSASWIGYAAYVIAPSGSYYYYDDGGVFDSYGSPNATVEDGVYYTYPSGNVYNDMDNTENPYGNILFLINADI